MTIRFIQDAKSGLITMASDATGLGDYGFHSEVTAGDLVALAAELFLSPEELGKATLVIGAHNPQQQAAALGVPFTVRA